MKLKTLAAAMAVTTLIAAGPVLADEPSIEIKRGAASGLIAGAVVGGPAGAFVGTVLGGEVFGRLFEQRRVNRSLSTEVADLHASLKAEREQHTTLVSDLNEDLDKVLALQGSQLKKRQLPIQFRTASADIEHQYEQELHQIARLLNRNKDASVTLAGYADRRGDADFNQKLSEDRVKAITSFLKSEGVSQTQILGIAFGEHQPLGSEESLEGNFFDRRVVVELNLNLDPQLATR